MTDSELLLALSDILPRLDNIESCYTDTYKRYKNYADKSF